jgi:hypothetical protein
MSARTVLLSGLLALADCLPEAGPGLGERRIEGRDIANLGAAPMQEGQPRTLFFTRKGVTPFAGDPRNGGRRIRDLYVSRPGLPELPLLTDFPPSSGFQFDTRGRLYVVKDGQVLILDVATGSQIEVGQVRGRAGMSPGGSQYFLTTENNTTLVRTADDIVREVPHRLPEPVFVDEVLYGSDGQRLWRVRPDGSPPDLLAENLQSFRLVLRPGQPPAFVLVNNDRTCPRLEARLFRPEAPTTADPLGTADGFPSQPGVTVDDGRVVLREPTSSLTETAFQVITLEPRSVRRFVVPTAPRRSGRQPSPAPPECRQVFNAVQVAFRPGTGEMWALGPGSLTIIHPDGRMESHSGPFQSFQPILRPSGSQLRLDNGGTIGPSYYAPPFSLDGRVFAYRDGQGRLQLARVSDPGGPGLIQLPDSVQVLGVADLPAGMTMVVWTSTGGNKTDVQLYDAELMVRRKTLQDVRSLLFGDRRLVSLGHGVVHDEYAPSDLDLIDLPSDQVQRIAGNVTEFLHLPACPTCDPTAPGARLAYVASARVPWKHDGLWTATLP